MKFEGLWSSKTHPKDFPSSLWLTHFSDIVGATHDKNYSFWAEGQWATDGVRQLAEWGSTAILESELRQQVKRFGGQRVPCCCGASAATDLSFVLNARRERNRLETVRALSSCSFALRAENRTFPRFFMRDRSRSDRRHLVTPLSCSVVRKNI